MILNLEQLKEMVVDLPDDERAELAKFLVGTFDESNAAEIRSDWIAVAKRRLEELRSGRVVGVPAEQVLENLLKPTP